MYPLLWAVLGLLLGVLSGLLLLGYAVDATALASEYSINSFGVNVGNCPVANCETNVDFFFFFGNVCGDR